MENTPFFFKGRKKNFSEKNNKHPESKNNKTFRKKENPKKEIQKQKKKKESKLDVVRLTNLLENVFFFVG